MIIAKRRSFRGKSLLGLLVMWFCFGGFCFGVMGREAMEKKRRMFWGFIRARGPWLKEKRRSLKMASQRKNEVVPTKVGEERYNGRMKKR